MKEQTMTEAETIQLNQYWIITQNIKYPRVLFVCLFCFFVCLFFGHATWRAESQFPDEEPNLCPLQWECGVLAIGSLRKSSKSIY